METKFQTSFIPKKPILTQTSTVARSRSTVSLFSLFSILLFIISLAGAGFVVFYQNYLTNTQTQYEQTLQANENQFNPTLIATLQRASDKINTASQLLASHLAVSQVLNIIAALTAQNITFTSFSYNAPADASSPALISMKGQADSFSDIAFQSDIFGSAINYGTNTKIETPVLSNLSLATNGDVNFTFTAGIDQSDILYSKFIQ
jgi:hypothetical protein